MDRSLLLIALGTLLIATGGVIATYGWDLKSSADTRAMLADRARLDFNTRRVAVLRTLAGELIVNSRILDNPPIAETDPAKLSTFAPLPRLQMTGLSSAVASGIFAGPEEQEMFAAVLGLLDHLSDLNARIQFTETQMLRGDIAVVRVKLRDGAIRRQTRALLADFARLLATNGVDPNERFFKAPPVPSQPQLPRP